jgi:hypothetical protein
VRISLSGVCASWGYESQTVLARISKFDLEFLPLIDSLQMDPADPLDP